MAGLGQFCDGSSDGEADRICRYSYKTDSLMTAADAGWNDEAARRWISPFEPSL
jgi:hypothetical protein